VCCSVLQCISGNEDGAGERRCVSGAYVLQCVAVCCSELQCVAVRCCVLHCVVLSCSVLQRVAV